MHNENVITGIASVGFGLFMLGLCIFTTENMFQCAVSCALIFSGAGVMRWITSRWDFDKEEEK